jgi:hypothetical protein
MILDNQIFIALLLALINGIFGATRNYKLV